MEKSTKKRCEDLRRGKVKEMTRGETETVILFLIGSLGLGGAEKQMITLIHHLGILNYRCHLFVLEPVGALKGTIRGETAKVYTGGYGSEKGYLQRSALLIRAQIRLFKILKMVRPDIVHAFLPLTNFMGSLAGRLLYVPLIITSRRALGTHQDRYKGWRIFDILSFRLSHLVAVNSRAVGEDTLIRDLGNPSKLRLVYNGIDSAPFESSRTHRQSIRSVLGVPPNEKVVISIANLIPYKGLSDLLKAAALVIERLPEAKFLLVGEDRGIQEELEHEACHLGVSQRVSFLGQRLDIPDLLAASDLLALSSHEEGFSNVILEAMASGLPVVATDVGGNGEAVTNGLTGWLVAPKNPAAMADKILDLLSDKERSESWGKRGQNRIKEEFTIEKMVKGYLKLYRSGGL